MPDPEGRVLHGFEHNEDAVILRTPPAGMALVQTVDVLSPLGNNPRLFGQVAAANALSDVYAVGGVPWSAMNIAAFPAQDVPLEVFAEILAGGLEKIVEAGAVLAGGHTLEDAEIKYGLSVTGYVDPGAVASNAGLRPGDALVLTKPLGIGIITTAAKAGLAEKALTERIYRQMAALNRAARDVMVKYPVHSCTDVTGFALLGHSFEMAQGSGVTVHIQTENVPFHKEAWAFADMGLVPSGAYRNRDYAEAGVRLTREIARPMQDILYDPQTSGGLLIALPEEDAAQCLDELRQSVPQAAAVGYVTEKMDAAIYLE